MAFKTPVSVLVVIYTRVSHNVLMLQRKDDVHFWQSVTGSLESGEQLLQTAQREVMEETGFDCCLPGVCLTDCQHHEIYEIFAQYRYRYAPGVTHNQEHWFTLSLPDEWQPRLTEHTAYQWLPWQHAMTLTKSWSNGLAIQRLFSDNSNE